MNEKVMLSLDVFQVEYLIEALLKENQHLNTRCNMLIEENNRLESRMKVLDKIDEEGIAV